MTVEREMGAQEFTPYFSGSSADLVHHCAASLVLPRAKTNSPAATMGSAIHQHLHERNPSIFGPERACERLGAVAKTWDLNEVETEIFAARCRGFQWVPPEGCFTEQPLALMQDGTVEPVAGARGEYAARPSTVACATIDAFWSEPTPLRRRTPVPQCPEDSILWVIDFKTGSGTYVSAVEQNRQLRLCALLAARYTGAKYVVPAVVYVQKGAGVWDAPEHPWGSDELAEIERELVRDHTRLVAAQGAMAAGRQPECNEGPWCQWCPAHDRCPPKVAMVRAVVTGEIATPIAVPLTPEQRQRAAVILPQLDTFTRKLRALLQADTTASGPVDRGDGTLWGPHEVEEEVIDPELGSGVIGAELGPDGVREALTMRLPKSGIERAVKTVHAAAGIKRQAAATVRRIFAKLHEEQAISKRTSVEYGVYKAPAPETVNEG